MPLLVPDVGEVQLLTEKLSNGENWTLRLYQNDKTPAETDTLVDYTEADFTGYASTSLIRSIGAGNWGTPTTNAGITFSEYDAPNFISWTNTGATQTIYGYYFEGITSGVLILAERFAQPHALNTNDVLNVRPRIELD